MEIGFLWNELIFANDVADNVVKKDIIDIRFNNGQFSSYDVSKMFCENEFYIFDAL